MTDSSPGLDDESRRYPLSFTQEWFCALDQGDTGGAFGDRFLILAPLRVTGPVDIAVLQGALDDVVARHELLRTIVVRDDDPPYQLVRPPCPVPLEIRDVPPVTGKSRDLAAQELIVAAQQGTISAREVPLLRALLCRFDDRDSVLFVKTHHSVSDLWSLQVLIRDLGAFYAARSGGSPARLPAVRQYREYSQWQKSSAASQADDGAPRYWRERLHGAREFTIPTDRVHPASYSSPFSAHNHVIEPAVVTAAYGLAAATRSSPFMVMLSAIYVLAHQITGATDLAIRAFTSGRGEPQFHDTMGLFLNLVPFRTDLSGCLSFRDVVSRARETCIGAYAHELPFHAIEQAIPAFITARENPRTAQFCLSDFQPQFGDLTVPIAEGAREIRELHLDEPERHDVPQGMVWSLDVTPSGTMIVGVVFNIDEFDESTVAG